MFKALFIFLLGVLIFEGANAQKKTAQKKTTLSSERDTVLYYMKNSGKIVTSRDSADYFLFIMPADTSSELNLYPVTEIYPNGKRKLIGTSLNRSSFPNLTGAAISFSPNGKRESVKTYDNAGWPVGNLVAYYPNGQLYTIEKYKDDNKQHDAKLLLMECRDSTGKILAENGNGKWLKFNEDFKIKLGEGQIINGFEEGEWHGSITDLTKYVCTYKAGSIVTGIGYDESGKEHSFAKAEIPPEFPGGIDVFYKFLQQNLHYPDLEKDHHIQGKVYMSFTIEKDGRVTNIEAIRGPTQSMVNEAVRVVKLSPQWHPGIKYGLPARITYTVPISFSL